MVIDSVPRSLRNWYLQYFSCNSTVNSCDTVPQVGCCTEHHPNVCLSDEGNYENIQIDSEKDGTFNSNLVLRLHNLGPSLKAIKSFVVISLVHPILQAQKLNSTQSADDHTKEERSPPHREQNQVISWGILLKLVYCWFTLTCNFWFQYQEIRWTVKLALREDASASPQTLLLPSSCCAVPWQRVTRSPFVEATGSAEAWGRCGAAVH